MNKYTHVGQQKQQLTIHCWCAPITQFCEKLLLAFLLHIVVFHVLVVVGLFANCDFSCLSELLFLFANQLLSTFWGVLETGKEAHRQLWSRQELYLWESIADRPLCVLIFNFDHMVDEYRWGEWVWNKRSGKPVKKGQSRAGPTSWYPTPLSIFRRATHNKWRFLWGIYETNYDRFWMGIRSPKPKAIYIWEVYSTLNYYILLFLLNLTEEFVSDILQSPYYLNKYYAF